MPFSMSRQSYTVKQILQSMQSIQSSCVYLCADYQFQDSTGYMELFEQKANSEILTMARLELAARGFEPDHMVLDMPFSFGIGNFGILLSDSLADVNVEKMISVLDIGLLITGTINGNLLISKEKFYEDRGVYKTAIPKPRYDLTRLLNS